MILSVGFALVVAWGTYDALKGVRLLHLCYCDCSLARRKHLRGIFFIAYLDRLDFLLHACTQNHAMKAPWRTDNHIIMRTGTKKQTQKTMASGPLVLAVSQIGKMNARYRGNDIMGAANRSAAKSAAAYNQSALSIFQTLTSKYAKRLIANKDRTGSKTK